MTIQRLNRFEFLLLLLEQNPYHTIDTQLSNLLHICTTKTKTDKKKRYARKIQINKKKIHSKPNPKFRKKFPRSNTQQEKKKKRK